jgi:hypothetical protein
MDSQRWQFYIGNDEDVLRCRQSRVGHRPITITGKTENEETMTFTGIVVAVEYVRTNPPRMSWRVTMVTETSDQTTRHLAPTGVAPVPWTGRHHPFALLAASSIASSWQSGIVECGPQRKLSWPSKPRV